jgi:hypothetical protein
MIEFKNPLVRVRCLECKELHFIQMKYIDTDKFQRSIGFEYEHIFRGELKCSHCEEKMQLITIIYEFPKGVLNYHETSSKSCLWLDEITEDSLKVCDKIDLIKEDNAVHE